MIDVFSLFLILLISISTIITGIFLGTLFYKLIHRSDKDD